MSAEAEKAIKLALLNIGIAAVNIAAFGLLRLRIDGTDAFQTALGITLIFVSVIVFFGGNIKLLNKKQKPMKAIEINSLDECTGLLEQNRDKKTFADDINVILEQIKRFDKKKQTINDILLQKFSSSEMSYAKFQGVISDVQNVFFINIKSILNRLNAFDQDEYDQIVKSGARNMLSPQAYQNKMGIFNEYISFVKGAVEDDENILLKLDKVLLEISKYNSLEDGELENMSAMKEIDALIKDAKLFK